MWLESATLNLKGLKSLMHIWEILQSFFVVKESCQEYRGRSPHFTSPKIKSEIIVWILKCLMIVFSFLNES